MEHIIGLDIGTTGCKACVFTPDGRIAGEGFKEYGIICTGPSMAEQDAEAVWAIAVEVLSKAVTASGVRRIAAIGISVQGDAIIALGPDIHPVHNAILGMDYRSEPQAQYCRDRFGDRALFERTGMRAHPMNSLVKMLWLRQERPDVFSRTKRIVTYADFAALKLSGEARIDLTMASRTMAFDLIAGAWATDILEALGIDVSLLSPVVSSGDVIGTMLPQLAAQIGLENRPLIVAGGHDQPCAAVGAGVVHAGSALISTGTAEVMAATFDKPRVGDAMYESYFPCYHHAVPGMYFTFSLNHTGGILFRWYRDTLGVPEALEAAGNGRDPYSAIVDAMPRGPSPVMVLPHFNGSGTPFCDTASRGAFVGLTMATTRNDIALAVLESLCFELKINCERLAKAGISVDNLAAVGGGAKSQRWLQLKADILGRPVRTLAIREAACLGAALIGGTAAGLYVSVIEGARNTVRTATQIEPDPAMVELYRERFGIYEKLYGVLRPVNSLLKG